jgi:hypothetical protein
VEYWYQGGTAQANLVEKSSGGGGSEQIQSDWNQTDSTKKDFIKNKPNIPDTSDYYTKSQSDDKYQRKVAGKGLSANDYTNEEKQKVAVALVPADIPTITAEERTAMQSGITQMLVEKLKALPTNSELETLLDGKQDTLTMASVETCVNLVGELV